jgi:hypothetical protein
VGITHRFFDPFGGVVFLNFRRAPTVVLIVTARWAKAGKTFPKMERYSRTDASVFFPVFFVSRSHPCIVFGDGVGPKIVIILCCVMIVLAIISVVSVFWGGVLGGILAIFLMILGIIAIWLSHALLLFIFLILCVILAIFALISAILSLVRLGVCDNDCNGNNSFASPHATCVLKIDSHTNAFLLLCKSGYGCSCGWAFISLLVSLIMMVLYGALVFFGYRIFQGLGGTAAVGIGGGTQGENVEQKQEGGAN